MTATTSTEPSGDRVPATAGSAAELVLPITAWRDEIAEAIGAHQVLIVAGETGSGKTTQLPQICLELGRRSIAHTQPRRIAARTVAERIAEEQGTELGDVIGYQVRFTRRASKATRLKVMTDGVLLAEIGHDRDLRRYDTIIIDEAHERSLNIDFLLGYLRQLTARRRDLKIIITSATIDTDRFAAHFASADGTPAPIIEVSGRTFPVEIRYRPLDERQQSDSSAQSDQGDQLAGLAAAVKELASLGDGDILVFLSGEREIRDATELVDGLKLRHTSVLPLYARLSSADQHRIFETGAKRSPGRRIVLATNVAETSLTVPGIRYVIDAGMARISRYSVRTKVQRLPIEPISQASANQRAGRCGRVAPGVAIRLYSEEDFDSRPEFTEPEILRTNLASVILAMTAADLGDIASFPFVEPPDNSQITDGLRLLTELGALSDEGTRERPRLTTVGTRLAAIPLDPRMARMLLAADEHRCLREMLIIVSGLSIQDPRERPPDQREKADALHRRFWASADTAQSSATQDAKAAEAEPGSDILALLELWSYLRDQQQALSGNAFRRMCREEFLHFLRIREWQDLHAQLKQICRELGLDRNTTEAGRDQVHTAALTGLLSHVGMAEVREETTTRGRGGPRKPRRTVTEYLGARGSKFAINPGSSLARTPPPLVIAAEIVETTRLWARTVAPVTAAQVEGVGGHLLKRSYSEPHWSARAGSVLAYENVSLYGVPIVARRPVGYGRINPAEAREIFLRSALVEGQWRTRHHFYRDNQALRAEAEALEERARRRDLLVDDETILAFYDARVPGEITSVAHFDAWWKRARHQTPQLLTMTLDDLTTSTPTEDPDHAFPTSWSVGETALDVDYIFDPASERDGVIVTIPVGLLAQLDPGPFSWQVPGLRAELATELVRSLPKAIRRTLVPVPDFARRALDFLVQSPQGSDEPLPQALGRALRSLTGEVIDAEAWDVEGLPRHLRITFDIVGESSRSDSLPGQPSGGLIDSGKDLAELQRALAATVSRSLSDAAGSMTRTGSTTWDFRTLSDEVELQRDGHRLTGYPALVDEGSSVGLRMADTRYRQAQLNTAGLRRLVVLNTPDPTKWVIGYLSNTVKLALGHSPYASVPALLADARLGCVGTLIEAHHGASVRDEPGFRALVDAVRSEQPDQLRKLVDLTATVLAGHGSAVAQLPAVRAVSPAAADDLGEQLANLVFAGFLSATTHDHLVDLPRYLQAASARIKILLTTPARDLSGLETILACEQAYAELCAAAPPGRLPVFIDDIGWQLEELRISLFAQPQRTKSPVSRKRVFNAIADARTRIS